MIQLFLFLFTLSTLFAAPKHNLSICALFKSESPYLKEWIEYHKLIGVDHFYLYDNGSLDESRRILRPYIQSKVVTLVQWPELYGPIKNDEAIWVLSTQIPAYQNAAKWKALHKTKWLLFLDIDEFLVPSASEKITDILKEHENEVGIILSSETYDASKRNLLPPRKLVIESTEITTSQKGKGLRAVEKTIFKPELCDAISWPPYHCTFKGGKKAITANKKQVRINRYENRMRFQRISQVKKTIAVDREAVGEKEWENILQSGYEIEDMEKTIHRFLPDLYRKMSFN